MRIRRSIAWTRGHDFEKTREQIASVADAITIDLEDGVPEQSKDEARKKAVEMLTTWDFCGKERIVRVNPVNSPHFEADMREVVALALPDALRVPKCEYAEEMLRIDTMLSEIEDNASLPRNSIEVLAMIESPIGIRNGYEIATCCARITALSLGLEDLTREMGVQRRYHDNELDFLYARQKMVLDAKAAGVQAIDSGLLIEENGTEASNNHSLRSKQDGFVGRSVRDNSQAVFANQVYMPSKEEVAWARGAVETYEQCARDSLYEANYQGKKICYAAYEKALDLIAYYERIREHEAAIAAK